MKASSIAKPDSDPGVSAAQVQSLGSGEFEGAGSCRSCLKRGRATVIIRLSITVKLNEKPHVGNCWSRTEVILT